MSELTRLLESSLTIPKGAVIRHVSELPDSYELAIVHSQLDAITDNFNRSTPLRYVDVPAEGSK